MFTCPFCGFRFETVSARDEHVDHIVGAGLIDADADAEGRPTR